MITSKIRNRWKRILSFEPVCKITKDECFPDLNLTEAKGLSAEEKEKIKNIRQRFKFQENGWW